MAAMVGRVIVALVALAACGPKGTPARAPRPHEAPPPPPLVDDEAAGPRRVHPGVLRGLLLEGALRVEPDAALAAELASRTDDRPLLTRIEVCLDVAGAATYALEQASAVPAFDRAALALVEGWRFQPYRDGATPVPVCSTAVLWHGTLPATADQPARAIEQDALPDAALELPAAVLVPMEVARDQRTIEATAGVALAWVCRRPGAVAAPELALIQSSGDARVDRELVERRMVVQVGEPPDWHLQCTTWAAIAPRPGPPAPAPAVAAGPAPADARGLPPRAFEAQRIAGEPRIYPAVNVKMVMARDGRTQFVVPVKVCVDTRGVVTAVTILKSSGYAGYDADLVNGIASWRYSPFTIDGVPAPACGMVNFAYRQT